MNNLRQKVNIHKETVVGCPTNFDLTMVLYNFYVQETEVRLKIFFSSPESNLLQV